MKISMQPARLHRMQNPVVWPMLPVHCPRLWFSDGIDCRVIMPLYGDLKFKDTLTYVTNFSVPVGWRSQYCGLFKAEHDGVTFYFIDNEYYF